MRDLSCLFIYGPLKSSADSLSAHPGLTFHPIRFLKVSLHFLLIIRHWPLCLPSKVFAPVCDVFLSRHLPLQPCGSLSTSILSASSDQILSTSKLREGSLAARYSRSISNMNFFPVNPTLYVHSLPSRHLIASSFCQRTRFTQISPIFQ